jgi:hypothetical protein
MATDQLNVLTAEAETAATAGKWEQCAAACRKVLDATTQGISMI